MVIFSSMESIFSIMIMIGIGYFISRLGWLGEGTSALFSKIIINIAVPGYMISSFLETYDKEMLIELAGGVVIPFTSMIILYYMGVIIAKLTRMPSNRRGIFASTLAISNTLFVGLPVNVALFGDSSIPYVFVYFIANITLFWTIGAYGIARDGGNTKGKHIFKENLKRLFSPPLCAFILAVIFVLLDVKLPEFLMDTCRYMGNLTTPLSMLYIGNIIYSIDFKALKWDKSMSIILIGRFLVAPLAVFFMCMHAGVPLLMKKVFIIQAAMPAMTVTSVLAQASGGDYKYAAVVTTLTTIATLLFIPIYIIILTLM